METHFPILLSTLTYWFIGKRQKKKKKKKPLFLAVYFSLLNKLKCFLLLFLFYFILFFEYFTNWASWVSYSINDKTFKCPSLKEWTASNSQKWASPEEFQGVAVKGWLVLPVKPLSLVERTNIIGISRDHPDMNAWWLTSLYICFHNFSYVSLPNHEKCTIHFF